MPGPILTVAAIGTCPHGAPLQIAPGGPRVLLSGMPVATTTDVATIAGCPFQIPIGTGTKPQPCVTVQLIPAPRVLVMGNPVVVATPPGLCKSVEQIPQGPDTIATVQMRVIA
jgi:hypothetical protein